MSYEEMKAKLDSTSDAVDVTYYGKTENGQYTYAVVSLNESPEIEQDDFPAARTCTASPQADFIVSLLSDFGSDSDVSEAQQFCGVYAGQ